MTENKDIELRSDEVQEILGTPPRWIIRWGITIIISVLFILLAGSYFYKYPDLIKARVTIISENPPVHLVAKISGKITNLFVSDMQNVEKDQLLGIIENPADFDNVFILKAILDSIGNCFIFPAKFKTLNFSRELNLGTIQPFYTSFVAQWREYITFSNANNFDQRIVSLQRQRVDLNINYNHLQNQLSIMEDGLLLAKGQFNRDSTLRRKNVMTDVEFEKSQDTYLKQKLNYETKVAELSSVLMEINKINQQIDEQKIQKTEKETNMLAALKEKYDNLISQYVTWEQNFVLKSPLPGKITFNTFWTANQFVTMGNIVFTIIPAGNRKIFGRALLPVSGAGKVVAGQRVNIKLDNYPHIEYGIIEGSVDKISMVPVNTPEGSYYTIEINLSAGLVTNFKKELPANQEMTGVAEVITKDRRLIERLVQPLVAIFRERMSS